MMARSKASIAAAAALVLSLLACSLGSGTPTPTVQPPKPSSDRPTATAISFLPEPTEPPTEDPGECEPPTPEINVGEPVNSQVPPPESPDQNRMYFCVMIPEQSTRAVFDLSGTTAPLNLYVGFPDLETVQEGGVLYWSDTSGEDGDKQVVAEMGVRDYLFAGPYYVEVSPDDFSETSPFTLLVTVQRDQ